VDLTTLKDTIDREVGVLADRARLTSGVPGADEESDEANDTADAEALTARIDDATNLPWPTDLAAWAKATFCSPMVGAPADQLVPFVKQDRAGRPGQQAAPLLLTRRMYVEQLRVARALAARAPLDVPEAAQVRDLEKTLTTLFPNDTGSEAAAAVRLAATKRLALIVGGPGTGKTFSVTRLLAALLMSHGEGAQPPSIALAAPTGKAAARMREAIREATDINATPKLDVPERVRERLQSLPATTLHRLVGIRPDGTSRHTKDNPIAAQLVIVDEVSMVDLTMMRRLLEAVHPESRLVLLGDRDQLASVEAGCVLADLVPAGRAGPLAASTQAFTHSRRFGSAPNIALVAACLQSYATQHEDVPKDDPAGALTRALDVFAKRAHATKERHREHRIEWLGVPDHTTSVAKPTAGQLDQLASPYLEGIVKLTTGPDTAPVTERTKGFAAMLREAVATKAMQENRAWQRDLLKCFDHYRVLAVHRRGPLGVFALERELARRTRAFIHAGAARQGAVGYGHWIGRPILITENAYDVGLMNGDVGIVLDLKDGAAAVFPHEDPNEVRVVSLARLPPHEGALAMTVHKSQGSQFDHVALVLAGRDSPIQTRELVYTGVTRAKQRLSWLGSEDELRTALDRQVRRESGLPDLLDAALATST
jgi:exodeoxyribonuclease V alpha subunit